MTLADELTKPQYAAMIEAGDDSGCADLLNTHQDDSDVLPPVPYDVQSLLLAVGAQGVAELGAAGLLQIIALAGPMFDFGKDGVKTMIETMLRGNGPNPACPHCLDVLPILEAPTACTRYEAIRQVRNVHATHFDVATALGRGDTVVL